MPTWEPDWSLGFGVIEIRCDKNEKQVWLFDEMWYPFVRPEWPVSKPTKSMDGVWIRSEWIKISCTRCKFTQYKAPNLMGWWCTLFDKLSELWPHKISPMRYNLFDFSSVFRFAHVRSKVVHPCNQENCKRINHIHESKTSNSSFSKTDSSPILIFVPQLFWMTPLEFPYEGTETTILYSGW